MVITAAYSERVADEKIHTDNGETWILSYYVQIFLGDGCGQGTSAIGEEYYGLRVEKRRAKRAMDTGETCHDSSVPSKPDTNIVEYEETGGITESRDEIFSMASAFAQGTVPPVTLLEMVDDWMSDF